MKPMDLSKFRKAITKSIDGLSIGFNDPTTWVSTGSYVLNYMMSRDFNKGIPLGKVTMLAGESGSGKSYIASGNVVRDAQRQGIFVVLVDTENALDEAWLAKLGVDTSEDKLLRVGMSMVDDLSKFVSEFVASYRSSYADVPKDERPKVLIVVDSLGMLLTNTEVNQFDAGDLKGDMGRGAKALKQFIKNCVHMFGSWEIGMLCTNHTYASQDMFNPDDKISGGQGVVFASSNVIAMRKSKLKEDESGNKTSEVHGIRSRCQVMKSRYNKPFENCELHIPYSTGMDPYTGLVDFFEHHGVLAKDGNKLAYTSLDGTVTKLFRKQFDKEILDKMMTEFTQRQEHLAEVGQVDDAVTPDCNVEDDE